MALDVTFRLQIPHRAGQLARVAQQIADHCGLIGDVVTLSVGRELSLREITIEVRDPEHAWEIAKDLDELDGVRVLWHRDRAFIRHEGGKLEIEPLHPVTTLQQMRDVYTPGVARVCEAIAQSPAPNRLPPVASCVSAITSGSPGRSSARPTRSIARRTHATAISAAMS